MDAITIDEERRSRLVNELSFAVKCTPPADLHAWASRIPHTLAFVTTRRVKNLGNLARWAGHALKNASSGIAIAVSKGNVKGYLATRVSSVLAALRTAKTFVTEYSGKVSANPQEEAPKLLAGMLGFLIGSGGTDGDGGIPDLDLLGGIGDHRSIFTHSIVAGAVVETVVLSIVDLADTVSYYLPEEHDPLWQELRNRGNNVLLTLAQGLSAGIAYHLGIDATVDGAGAYVDFPWSMPQEGHQTVLAANAIAEANDAATRSSAQRGSSVHNTRKRYPTYENAATVARRNPGCTVARSPDGEGFVVRM